MKRSTWILSALSILGATTMFGFEWRGQNVNCGLQAQDLGRFVRIPPGTFILRSNPKYSEEQVPKQVKVGGFYLQINEVTNDEFSRFVGATGYRTSAERTGESALFSDSEAARAEDPRNWWKLSKGTVWWTPSGPGSHLEGKGNHPVVHMSWRDANAYAKWAGGRLLTEIEWEYAASLGLQEPDSPDSGAIGPKGEMRANIWNGPFPKRNTAEDGFVSRAPVGCFPASKIGAYDMIGNVWEWTSTPFDRHRYTIKGGSHLCAESYCHRYRVASRQAMEADFSAEHIGFRIAHD